ncbi:MAG: superinfection immunity protein [Luteitalea sp.]|nr:superinfection immunity protein [Luteitalea sp.]
MGILSLGALLGCSTTDAVRQARGTRVKCSVLPALGIFLAVIAAPAFSAVESEARGDTARAHVEGVAETHIFVLTLLLGWSVLGWIAALVWSCTAVHRSDRGGETV